MVPVLSLFVEICLTIITCILLVRYLRRHLWCVLVDLCLTDEGAQFWTAFADILLVGLPLIISMGFRPRTNTIHESVFEIIRRLSGALAGFIFAIILVAIGVAFFALVATRWTKGASK